MKMFGRKKSKIEEWKIAKTEPKTEVVPAQQTQPVETQPQPVAQVPVETKELEQAAVDETPKTIEAPITPPQQIEKPAEKIAPTVTNPTIDTFTILVKYHEEMIAAVSKYDGIIAELIKLTQPVGKDEEKN